MKIVAAHGRAPVRADIAYLYIEHIDTKDRRLSRRFTLICCEAQRTQIWLRAFRAIWEAAAGGMRAGEFHGDALVGCEL